MNLIEIRRILPMVSIVEVTTHWQLRRFVDFPN